MSRFDYGKANREYCATPDRAYKRERYRAPTVAEVAARMRQDAAEKDLAAHLYVGMWVRSPFGIGKITAIQGRTVYVRVGRANPKSCRNVAIVPIAKPE